jgi:hypothetical protein
VKNLWTGKKGVISAFFAGLAVGIASQGCAIIQWSQPKVKGDSNVIESPKVGSGKVEAKVPTTAP